jgi:hypothetical protein
MQVDDGERRAYPLGADHEAPLEAATELRRAAATALAVTQNAALDGPRAAVSPQRQAMGGIRVRDLTRHPPADRKRCDCAE